MVSIEWDTSLSVGVELIDEQHKMLIQRLRGLSEAIEATQGTVQIMKTLDFLIDYTDFHFSTEEKHMTELAYPGLDVHREQHGVFKDSLSRLVEDFEEEGATSSLAESVNVFLINWLINHIKGVDMEFGDYLREKDMTLMEEK